MQTISKQYCSLNARLHAQDKHYGTSSVQWTDKARELSERFNTQDILDYGCGKTCLARNLSFPIKNYDPAIAKYLEKPESADLVFCNDVMEHVEPIYTDSVLSDIRIIAKVAAFFTISTVPSKKTLADGRNTHINLKQPCAWKALLERGFEILEYQQMDSIAVFLCRPKESVQQELGPSLC